MSPIGLDEVGDKSSRVVTLPPIGLDDEEKEGGNMSFSDRNMSKVQSKTSSKYVTFAKPRDKLVKFNQPRDKLVKDGDLPALQQPPQHEKVLQMASLNFDNLTSKQ